MSKQSITQLLERALNDQAFAKQLKSNFDAAIKGYDLTADEIAAEPKGETRAERMVAQHDNLGGCRTRM